MKAVTAHPIIDGVLDQHLGAMGDDLGAYRNHVYRCLNYQQLLLGLRPRTPLGIWTADTFDYLSPSAELATTHATEFGITIVDELPYLGFHAFLARDLTQHPVRHPTRPLPMLRW
jgi:hypothetical protein